MQETFLPNFLDPIARVWGALRPEPRERLKSNRNSRKKKGEIPKKTVTRRP